MNQNAFRSGYVSIIGKPNVGKSTLLNAILGEKVSIVTPKPQTTRNKIVGIKNLPNAQIIFIDTPGVHIPKHKLGNTMVKVALDSIKAVDIILFMIEPNGLSEEDKLIIEQLRKVKSNVFLLINKIDKIKKDMLLLIIDDIKNIYPFKEIIPISALKNDGLDILINKVYEYLPIGPKYYPDDIVTDQMERFMVAEIIREKIIYLTGEEVPYSVAVDVVEWKERQDGLISISCNIYVERDGQKAIIIGKGGEMTKKIGTMARHDIERLLNTKVFLKLWVKVKKSWRDNIVLLKELGYQ